MRTGSNIVAWIAAGLLALAPVAQAKPAPATLATARAAVAEVRAATPTPALSVAVVRGGEVVWAEAFGSANLELDAPATPQTRFRLGSVSKVVTATLAARLAEQGVLDLDAPISRYMPDLPQAHRATTLRQLLGHQGGIRHYEGKDMRADQPGGSIDQREYADTAATLALFINDPLVAPPGTKSHYSTFGYTLASAVIEAAAKRPFVELVETLLAEPLGLTSLEADAWRTPIKGRTAFYDPTPAWAQAGVAAPFVNAPQANAAYKWAGGGFVATPSDVARFGYAVIRPGYVNAATHRMMFTPLAAADGTTTNVALGWRVDKDAAGRVRWHHAGSSVGGRAMLLVYPEHDLSIALMSNLTQTPSDALGAAEKIAAPFLAR